MLTDRKAGLLRLSNRVLHRMLRLPDHVQIRSVRIPENYEPGTIDLCVTGGGYRTYEGAPMVFLETHHHEDGSFSWPELENKTDCSPAEMAAAYED